MAACSESGCTASQPEGVVVAREAGGAPVNMSVRASLLHDMDYDVRVYKPQRLNNDVWVQCRHSSSHHLTSLQHVPLGIS